MPAYVVYVPQGRIGRYRVESSQLGYTGLYTDGFSSCNVVAIFGKKGEMTLIHVDLMFPAHLINAEIAELERIEKSTDSEVFVLHRGEFDALAGRDYILENIVKRPTVYQVPRTCRGILLTNERNEEADLHPNLRLISNADTPAELIRHPDEKYFQTSTKIEMIFSPLYNAIGCFPDKTAIIFNGYHWIGVQPKEKKPQTIGDELIEMFWDRIIKNRGSFLKTTRVIGQVLDNERKFLETILARGGGLDDERRRQALSNSFADGKIVEMALGFALSVNLFLNNFEAMETWIADLSNCITLRAPEARTETERKIDDDLKQMLKRGDSPEEFKTKLIALRALPDSGNPDYPYLFAIKHDLSRIVTYYDICMVYAKQAQMIETATRHKIRCSVQAIKAYRERDYEAAEMLFRETLNHAHIYMTDTTEELATAYYNLARSIQQQGGRHREALEFFFLSGEIHKNIGDEDSAKAVKVKRSIEELTDFMRREIDLDAAEKSEHVSREALPADEHTLGVALSVPDDERVTILDFPLPSYLYLNGEKTPLREVESVLGKRFCNNLTVDARHFAAYQKYCHEDTAFAVFATQLKYPEPLPIDFFDIRDMGALGYGLFLRCPVRTGTILTYYLGKIVPEAGISRYSLGFGKKLDEHQTAFAVDLDPGVFTLGGLMQHLPDERDLLDETLRFPVDCDVATENVHRSSVHLIAEDGLLCSVMVTPLVAQRDLTAGEIIGFSYQREYWEALVSKASLFGKTIKPAYFNRFGEVIEPVASPDIPSIQPARQTYANNVLPRTFIGKSFAMLTEEAAPRLEGDAKIKATQDYIQAWLERDRHVLEMQESLRERFGSDVLRMMGLS